MKLKIEKLIIHPGFGKCWSTTIQETFNKNSALYLDKGFFYSNDFTKTHHALFQILGDVALKKYPIIFSEFNIDLSFNFDNEFSAALLSKCSTFILSSEFLENLDLNDLYLFKDFLLNYFNDIEIAFVVRDPFLRYTSIVQQGIKIGLFTFESIIRSELSEIAQPIECVISKFEKVFGSSAVKIIPIYTETTPINLLEQISTVHIESDLFKELEFKSNESISIDSAHFLNYYSKIRPFSGGEEFCVRKSRADFVEVCLSKIPGHKFSLPSELFNRIKKFAESDLHFLKSRSIDYTSQSLMNYQYALKDLESKYSNDFTSYLVDKFITLDTKLSTYDDSLFLLRLFLFEMTDQKYDEYHISHIRLPKDPNILRIVQKFLDLDKVDRKEFVTEFFKNQTL